MGGMKDPLRVVMITAAIWCVVLGFSDFSGIWIYQLSRWALCAAAIWSGMQLNGWARYLMFITAVVFNPLQPIRFEQNEWKIVDFVAALAFFVPLAREMKWIKSAWSNRGAVAIVLVLGGGGIAMIVNVTIDVLDGGYERRAAEKTQVKLKADKRRAEELFNKFSKDFPMPSSPLDISPKYGRPLSIPPVSYGPDSELGRSIPSPVKNDWYPGKN